MNAERRSIRRLALDGLRRGGIFALTRRFSCRKARVLMYHNFAADSEDPRFTSITVIREQFEYLRRHFRVVSLQQIVRRLKSGIDLEPNSVAITVDDGRKNCYDILFPLLQEFDFPATFFVVSSFIRGEDWVWTDKVLWLSEQASAPEELHPKRLDATFCALNPLPPERRNARIAELAAKGGVVIPSKPTDKYAPCSWQQLREMTQSGLVDIGSHTVRHPIMSSISDDESLQELKQSRTEIEGHIGREVRCFCFPNGMQEDYRPSQLRQVADAGYACSVMANFGFVGRDTSPYRIPRIGMGQKSSAAEIAKYLDGLAYYQHAVTSAIRSSKPHPIDRVIPFGL